MQKGTQAYVQTKFSTVGQGEILLLLYDGAIKFLNQAKEKIREKDAGAKGILISKALDIINELDSSINMEAGGTLSKNLHQLYFVCSTRLLKANLRMDITAIDGVLEILFSLRQAYAQILNKPEARAASAKIASRMPATAATAQHAVPLSAPAAPAGMGMGMAQARSAYGQGALLPPPSPAPAAPGVVPRAPLAGTPLTVAQVAPAPSATLAPEQAAAAQVQVPPAPVVPAAPLNPVNLETRRSAAAARYGKIARTL